MTSHPQRHDRLKQKILRRSLGFGSVCEILSLLLLYSCSILFGYLGMYRRLWMYLIASMLLSVLATLLPALVMMKLGGGIRKFIRPQQKKTGAQDTAMLIVFGLSACVVINYLITLIFSFLPIDGGGINIVYDSHPLTAVLMVLALAATPALCEEVAYRGFLYGALRPYGQLGAAVLSSLFFGLAHSGVAPVSFALCAGFIICCIRKTSGRLWAGIIVHFLNNLLSVFGSIIRHYGGNIAVQFYISAAIQFALIGLCVAGLWLHYRKIPLFVFDKSRHDPGVRQKLLSALTTPAFVLLMVLFLLVKLI